MAVAARVGNPQLSRAGQKQHLLVFYQESSCQAMQVGAHIVMAMAWRSMAWHGAVPHGMAWRSMALCHPHGNAIDPAAPCCNMPPQPTVSPCTAARRRRRRGGEPAPGRRAQGAGGVAGCAGSVPAGDTLVLSFMCKGLGSVANTVAEAGCYGQHTPTWAMPSHASPAPCPFPHAEPGMCAVGGLLQRHRGRCRHKLPAGAG